MPKITSHKCLKLNTVMSIKQTNNQFTWDLNVIFSTPWKIKYYTWQASHSLFSTRDIITNITIQFCNALFGQTHLHFLGKWLCNSIKKHSPSQQNHVQSTLHLGPDHNVWVYFVKMNVRACKLLFLEVITVISPFCWPQELSNKSRLENQQCMSHSCKITQIFSVVMPTDSSLWAMGDTSGSHVLSLIWITFPCACLELQL